MRRAFYIAAALAIALVAAIALVWPPFVWVYAILGPLVVVGVYDICQTRRAVLRNFPVIGHGRYLMELIRPEINQYFIESNTDGMPFNREMRSVIYQRAKRAIDTQPFGTQRDVNRVGYEWVEHSLAPVTHKDEDPRVVVGEGRCQTPYAASLLNISAMSFGSLSKNAVLALNEGARRGGFAHNTGEGGISPYHLRPGGDLIWQIGTGYFGCRTDDGRFDVGAFTEEASRDAVRMIEVKLSQGAKPGHGGILPAEKVSEEIARIRKVPLGHDVLSPPAHSAFGGPREMLEFLAKLREASGGKPVGFKLCIGKRAQFLGICKAMIETGLYPDFVTVDGAEGGTGAAPLEFSNSVGMPLNDGLAFVHNALVGCALRDRVRVAAAGKITTGFHMATKLALGADWCNSARGMMFALGCIQALRCNTNKCPVGVATQDPELTKGIVVERKARRVHAFHEATIESLVEIVGAAGLEHPGDLEPWHVHRRVSPTETKHFAQIYPPVDRGALLETPLPRGYGRDWQEADPSRF